MGKNWTTVELDALPVGCMGRVYRVGTYLHEDGLVTAYTRDIVPEWPGFVEYLVTAPSAKDAKKAAMKHRRDARDAASRRADG